MNYIVHYEIDSILFLGLTSFFYFKQNKLSNFANKIYSCMLIGGLVAVVFDSISVLVEPIGIMMPIWSLYLINALFIIGMQFALPAFCFYTMVLGKCYHRTKIAVKGLILLPYLSILTLVLISPFSKYGIFYINENHIYQFGANHSALYIVSVIYLLINFYIITKYYKNIPKQKRITISIYFIAVVAAMAIQLCFPRYLVTTSACALGLVVMYHELESPIDQIDTTTGFFNRKSLPIILHEMFEQKINFSFLVFYIRGFSVIHNTFGEKIVENIILMFASFLRESFPRKKLIHVASDVFAIIIPNEQISKDGLIKIADSVPKQWKISDISIESKTALAVIYSSDCKTSTDIINTMDFIIQNTWQNASDNILVADSLFKKDYLYISDVEASILYSIQNNTLEVCYQPLIDHGKAIALEAFARIYDSNKQEIPAERFIKVAEQNGQIYQIGEKVLSKICVFIKDKKPEQYGIEYISVNLSVVQRMQKTLPQTVNNIINTYNVDPKMLCFEITDTEAMLTIPTVSQNMKLLKEAGFSFILDDFGSGYANYGYTIKLPFNCVKIDRELIYEALKSPKQKALLSGIKDVLCHLNLHTAGTGIENIEQSLLLNEIGIDYQQGYYYSKAMIDEEIIDYLEHHQKK